MLIKIILTALMVCLPIASYATTGADITSKDKCPECGAAIEELPVIYGYPSSEMLEMQERGEIILGGCVVDQDPGYRVYKCAKCSWRKRTIY